MKKIFTLIFSLGLLTAAFAQGGHRNRDYNSNSSSGNQSWVQGDQKQYGNDQERKIIPYSNSDDWKYQPNDRRNGNEENRDGFGDTDDMRWRSDNSRFEEKRFSKGINNRHFETYRRKPALQIFFGFGIHHK